MTEDRPRPVSMRWGLVPSWAKDDELGAMLINSRGENLTERTVFRDAFERRRCLVLADGYHEWAKDVRTKETVRIVRGDHEPFTFAGLWDRSRRLDGTDLLTFTIITTEASAALRPIHPRMPMILANCHDDRWLDPKLTATRVFRPLFRL